MGKLSEMRELIAEAEQTDNQRAHECLMALICLSSTEVVDEEMYEIILERIKSDLLTERSRRQDTER